MPISLHLISFNSTHITYSVYSILLIKVYLPPIHKSPPSTFISSPSSLFLRSLTYPTNSSNTPGHAPSSDHQPMDSSSKLFRTKIPVWSHMSLLTLFRQRSSRKLIHHSSQGVDGVAQFLEGFWSRSRQYSIAVSSCKDLWPAVRASKKVVL